MQIRAEDNFDRADNADLGTNWDVMTGEQNFTIASNAAAPTGPGLDCSERLNTPLITENQFAAADLTVNSSALGSGVGLAVRSIGTAQTYYRFVVNHTNLEIGRWNAGTFTILVNVAAVPTWVDGDSWTLTVETSGSRARLAAYLKDREVVSVWDSTPLAAGQPGIADSTPITSCSVNNFRCGVLTDSVRLSPHFPRHNTVLRRS